MSRVYFIRPVGMDGPVKIGCAKVSKDRVHQLALWSPFDLEMVASMEGDISLEERFHAYFIDDHHRQEWFHASPRMNETIAAVAAGTFDVSILPPSVGPIRVAVRMRSKETPEEWEYRQKYAEAMSVMRALPWGQRPPYPDAPAIYKQRAHGSRIRALELVESIIEAKAVAA